MIMLDQIRQQISRIENTANALFTSLKQHTAGFDIIKQNVIRLTTELAALFFLAEHLEKQRDDLIKENITLRSRLTALDIAEQQRIAAEHEIMQKFKNHAEANLEVRTRMDKFSLDFDSPEAKKLFSDSLLCGLPPLLLSASSSACSSPRSLSTSFAQHEINETYEQKALKRTKRFRRE